jgi:hypothetical protein
MRKLALALALLLGLAAGSAPAPAQEQLGAGEGAAIREVIESQLDAFRRDDGPGAFAYASPDIRAMFHDPDTFMGMVRGGYAAVYRPREVEFRGLGLEDGRWTQRVLFVGPDGVPVIARYMMERQPDGSWLIDGCVLEKAPDVTA